MLPCISSSAIKLLESILTDFYHQTSGVKLLAKAVLDEERH